MTEMAERYKMAEEIVLKRYATELGPKGQCQKWKITAIAQDRKDRRLDTSVLELFMDEVEREVNRLISVKPIVQELCKKACEPPAVVEKKPAEPESLPESPHGIDLDWN
jgi:hypothetical protein